MPAGDAAETVVPPMLALPDETGGLCLSELLSGDMREGFDRPSTLTAPDAPPFEGRACNRVPPESFREFVGLLDQAGMLGAVREPIGPASAFFAVRKTYNAERGAWNQRLILDRRPRNAEESSVLCDDTLPHGVCFADLILPASADAGVARLWCTDLPQYFYRMAVSEERLRSNVFTGPLEGALWEDFRAVRALREREGLDAGENVGTLHFGLQTMAMGDLNATSFAQAGHVEMLRRVGNMGEDVLMGYRRLTPNGAVREGVMIDDHAVVAVVPAHADWEKDEAAVRARGLHDTARGAYVVHGVPDVAAKRQVGLLTATVWGCEVQGVRGRAGVGRARRAALAALTVTVCANRVADVETLQRLVGLWVDVLMYRRSAFATLRTTYLFLEKFKDDVGGTVRTIPGRVITELLGLAVLAPILDSPMRAQLAQSLIVSDASPSGGGAVLVDAPSGVIDELWRRRVRPGGTGLCGFGTSRGDDAVGEILESAPARPFLAYEYPRTTAKQPHINVGEARARRAVWSKLSTNVQEHATRRIIVLDSAVVVGAATKGRSSAGALARELQRTNALVLAMDCVEGILWTESEKNTADSPSRQGPLPMPSPQRAWVDAFWRGDRSAMAARIAHGQGWQRDLTADGDVESNPGPPPLARLHGPRDPTSDLRVLARGTARTVQRRALYLERFEAWLAERGAARLGVLVQGGAVDETLADYGQWLWRTNDAQTVFVETVNAVVKEFPAVHGHVRRSWGVVSAWQAAEPGRNRAPVPPTLVRALVGLFTLWSWSEMAALVMLAFEGALRPGDVLGLERRDLRFADESGGLEGDALYVVLRHSKTATTRGARWQHVRIDCAVTVSLLRWTFGTCMSHTALFTCAGGAVNRSRHFAELFGAGLRALGAPTGETDGFVPSGLRAGGITALYQRTQSLELTRWRGRWDATRSMEHYIQELPMADAFNRMSAQTRADVGRVSALLPSILRDAQRERGAQQGEHGGPR